MIETAHGPARAHLHLVDQPLGAVVLGHGAGGGVDARDLVAVTEAAVAERFSVALVEQPYRVAGRRSPAPAHQLDHSWTDVVATLGADALDGLPLVTGGRSAGARVACRTAGATGALAVVCLAFPLHAPGRTTPAATTVRQAELDAVGVPTLVIQGENDPFGRPRPDLSRSRRVVLVAGNHSLTADLDAVARAARSWLGELAESWTRSSAASR